MGLRYNRNRARGRFFPLFSPRELFYGSVPGAWYDPTDLSTLFQDSAGTTPVTAVEQPVGLVLDKSQGLTNGPELSPNVGPYTSTTDWTGINSAVLSASGGELVITSGNTYSGAYITASVVAGTWLDVTIVARRGTATAAYVSILNQTNTVIVDGFGNPNLAIGATNTTIRTRFLVPAGMTQARLLVIHDNQANNRTLFCSSASAKTLAGNHASQSTAASRPTYRARYNLLTQSEDFGNAAWVKAANVSVTTNAIVAPDGTTTADLATATAGDGFIYQTTPTLILNQTYTFSVWLRSNSPASFTVALQIYNGTDAGGAQLVTVTSTWQRFTITKTVNQTNAYLVIIGGTVSGSPTFDAESLYIWGAQLLTAADVTATGNAYQRIAAATVYDTAPIFRPYLAFDGVDDSLATAAIDFTSTDKMTVFAGVTKNADANYMLIAETSANPNTTNGTFGLWNTTVGASFASYGNVLRGTAVGASTTAQSYASPRTDVLTSAYDLSGATIGLSSSMRINCAAVALPSTSGAAPGGGNFATQILYIGRRGGTSFPLNGRIYELIVRGAASSTTEIIDTETWVNQRTGGY